MQVDEKWIIRINVYVRDMLKARIEKLIRIDLKLSNFFMDGCHWIMNKAIREAFSDGCETEFARSDISQVQKGH